MGDDEGTEAARKVTQEALEKAEKELAKLRSELMARARWRLGRGSRTPCEYRRRSGR